MNDEERIGKKILLLMFLSCLVLLILVAGFCIYNSPKTLTVTYSSDDLEEEYYYSESSGSLAEQENSGVFPIPINTASFEELQLIPNIGPSTAQMIIDYRNEYGTIVSFNELLSINGIGEKTVEILKEYCIIF